MFTQNTDRLLIDHSALSAEAKAMEEARISLKQARAGETGTPADFLRIPFDISAMQKTVELADELKSSNLTYVFVLGIGGSHLGAQALYDGLRHTISGQFAAPAFIDYIDPITRKEIQHFLNTNIRRPDQILVNVVSKSGATAETLVSAEIMLEMLGQKFGNPMERFVFTTVSDSPLADFARRHNRPVLPIPAVSGRYSVFSPVGLFPLYLSGISISDILAGARDVTGALLDSDVKKNPALLSAAAGVIHYRAGKHIQNLFLEHRRLSVLGSWWRQLIAESSNKIVGGENNKEEGVGVLPSVYVAPSDNHSVLQHYLAGPRESFTQYLAIEHTEDAPRKTTGDFIKMATGGKDTLPDITNIYREELFGLFGERKLPLLSTTMPEITPYYLGAFMQMKMFEAIYLCEGLGVNPYTQPDIETFKKRMKAKF